MSLHLLLRTETRDAHDRIEAAFDLESCLSSPARYGDLLRELHAFHAAFESAAAAHLDATPLGPFLGRTTLLERDLAALGVVPKPARPFLPLASLPEAAGAAYVVEGSMLGGVVIAKRVESRLGLGPETGNAFFAGHGRDTARTWKAFCAALDGLADPDAEDEVVAAARRTYAVLQSHLVDRNPLR